jgi:hypothetical protein
MESSLEHFRNGWKSEMPDQLEKMYLHLEGKLHEFQQKFREFQAWKEAKENARSTRVRARYWKRRLAAERRALEQAINEYLAVLRLTARYGFQRA